jgi:molecular chaperone GrpE
MAEKTIEDLEQDLKSEHHLYLRALADFDNYRRRTDRERAQFGTESLRRFITPLLEIVDDLERLLQAAGKETTPFIDGARFVHQKLLSLLEKEGVRPFEAVGEQFDPTIHEVAGTVPADGKEEGAITQVVTRGYKFKDDLLRPARVVVAA